MHVEISGHVVPREKLAALTGAPLAPANNLELERSRDPALLGRLQREPAGGTGDDRAIPGSRPLPGFFALRIVHGAGLPAVQRVCAGDTRSEEHKSELQSLMR